MNNALTIAEGTLPMLIKNTRLHINIAGWPAAVSVIALCGAYIAVCAIRNSHSAPDRREVVMENTFAKSDDEEGANYSKTPNLCADAEAA